MPDIKVKLNEKPIASVFSEGDYLIAVVDGKLKRIENEDLKKLFEALTGLRLFKDGDSYRIQYLEGLEWKNTGFKEDI